ncbi:MAG: hypothetical protein PHG66_02375 [Candidatus Colwellbacteria bacterium]|nr:hypothetical protein [Candidatus Colwellbacteria bacterium]
MKKGRSIIVISSVAILIFAAAAAVIISPMSGIIGFGDKEIVRKAIASGKIEISSEADRARYFDYLDIDEVRNLLTEQDNKGDFKFLLPQFDISLGTVISEREKETEGEIISYITVRGLTVGTKIYADIDGFAAGLYEEKTDPPYIRTEERVISENPGTYDGVFKVMYVPTLYVPGGADSIFLSKLDEVLRRITIADPLMPIITDRTLAQIPDSQIALSIEKKGDRNLADLDNVLLSKNGKIVMVKR